MTGMLLRRLIDRKEKEKERMENNRLPIQSHILWVFPALLVGGPGRSLRGVCTGANARTFFFPMIL